MKLHGQRIWLTGASSGIGEALVAPLVARGARLAISARRAERLEAIAAPHPAGAVLTVPLDVTDRAAVLGAVQYIEHRWGGIDLALFNAGGHDGTPTGPFQSDTYTATMILNYFSVAYGLEAVLPAMLARGSGHVAAVASLAGYRATPIAPAYGASKAAVIHLMQSLRFDLEPRGVGVTVINPGFVKTPLTDRQRFKRPFLLEADDAAERIVRGLEENRDEIHFPAPMSWAMKLLRVIPYPIYEQIVRRTFARMASSGEARKP